MNLDQTPSCYVSPGKYSFHFKRSKHVPVKGVDDKRHIKAKFGECSQKFSTNTNHLYGKTKRILPKFNFPKSFSVSFTENYWSSTSKSVEFLINTVFLYFEKVKGEKCIPKEQYYLVTIDTFKGQDNDIPKQLCRENFREVAIVPHNLNNKFQPLDIFVKPGKALISNKYNSWFSKQVSDQLALRIEL